MGQKKEVKLEDIADSLGVSIVTVSNALKGKKGVSEGLRNRIKEAAQRMGYKTPVYEEKEKARSHIIGVLVAERYVKEFPSFYMEIYRRVAQETAKRGHVTVLEVVTCEKENLSADAMVFLEQSMDGLIVIGELYQEYMKMLRKVSRIPIVCVDYYDVYDDNGWIWRYGADDQTALKGRISRFDFCGQSECDQEYYRPIFWVLQSNAKGRHGRRAVSVRCGQGMWKRELPAGD